MNNYNFNNYRDAVAAAMNGIQEGFSYLYDMTFRDKYYVALKYVKNEETASDVIQDAYMRAFQNLSMLQDPDKFPGWIGMIVANTAKNYLKKKNPVLFSEMDQDNGEGDTLEYQDTLVEERADFNPEEYYSKKDGSLAIGYKAIKSGKKLNGYYFYEDGDKIAQMAKGTKIKYLKIPKSGRLDEAYALGIKVLDKKGWKLKTAFKYARNTKYAYRSMRKKSINAYAKFGFKNRKGNCFCKASQFFVMAKLLGYNVHMYKGKVGTATHSWTTIKHKDGTWMYDPVVNRNPNAWNHSFWYKFKKNKQKGTWRYSKGTRMD